MDRLHQLSVNGACTIKRCRTFNFKVTNANFEINLHVSIISKFAESFQQSAFNSWAVINTCILITAHELKTLWKELSRNFEIMPTRRFISKFTFETLKFKVRQFLIMLTPLTDSWWSLSISVWSKGNFNWSQVQLVYWFSLKKQRAKYVRRATWPIDVANWLCQGTSFQLC